MTRDYQAQARELLALNYEGKGKWNYQERINTLAARLQADADALAAYHETCRELHAKIRDLESQLAAAREDSERLDWLDAAHFSFGCSHVVREGSIGFELTQAEHERILALKLTKKNLRAAVDAARRERSGSPLPPDVMVSALQDRVHKETGISRPAKSVKSERSGEGTT